MDLWNTLIIGGGTLLSLIITIGKPLIKLNTTLVEVNATLIELRKDLEEAKESNQNTFKRAFKLLDELAIRLDDQEKILLSLRKDHDKDISILKREIQETEKEKIND